METIQESVVILAPQGFRKSWGRALFDEKGVIIINEKGLSFSGDSLFFNALRIEKVELSRRPFSWIGLLEKLLTPMSVYIFCAFVTIFVARIPAIDAPRVLFIPSFMILTWFFFLPALLFYLFWQDKWVRLEFVNDEQIQNVYYLSINNSNKKASRLLSLQESIAKLISTQDSPIGNSLEAG